MSDETANDGTIPWRLLYETAIDELVESDSPEVDARRILEQATGVDPLGFRAQLDEPVTVAAKGRFEAMVRRRARGEPLQYVVGRWGFRRLDLAVDRRVLIPRPETEVVAGFAIDEIDRRARSARQRSVRAVDLGTGSGAIALAIADECTDVFVWATEASDDALTVARANLAGLGRAATRVRMSHGSWFAALDQSWRGTIDVVISNPPYIAAEEVLPPIISEWEPTAALVSGTTGFEAIEAIVAESPAWLRSDGVLVVEIAPHQAGRAIRAALDAGFVDAEVREDLVGRPRALVAFK